MSETAEVKLVKGAPEHLYDGFFKTILGEEYCFRDLSGNAPCDLAQTLCCRCEKSLVDVSPEPNVRKAFRARDGYVLAAVDYSGVELRIAANLSREPVWVTAFQNGLDLHGETAKAIFGSNYTKQERQMAKCIRQGSKVKIRVLVTQQEPGLPTVTLETKQVTTIGATIPLLLESGVSVINTKGHEERKLARDLHVGDFIVEIPTQAKPINFYRPLRVLAQHNRYLHKYLTLPQVKELRRLGLDGTPVLGLTDATTTFYAREMVRDVDFATTDLQKPGDFTPFHNIQIWTRTGWQTAAFLYFDGLQDFWTLRVGRHKLSGTSRHLIWTKRNCVEDWISMSELNPVTDQVLLEENGQLLWKCFTIRCPEKITLKVIRSTEEDNRPFLTRDRMFDIVVPCGHEYIANGFVSHNTSNFSNLYGGTAPSLAASAQIPLQQAKDIWERWWGALPKLREWRDQVYAAAKASGYVKTAFGRRRSLKEYYDTVIIKDGKSFPKDAKTIRRDSAFGDRSALSTMVQGTAADIMKRALAAVHKYIVDHSYQNEVRLLLAVHDEIVFEIKLETLQQHLDWIVPIMVQTPKGWPVNLAVDVELGPSWGEVDSISELRKHNSPIVNYLRPEGKGTDTPKAEPSPLSSVSITPVPSSKNQDEEKVTQHVFSIEKRLWHKSTVVEIRKALSLCAGDTEPIFVIDGQTFRDSRLPRINLSKFTPEFERIKSAAAV